MNSVIRFVDCNMAVGTPNAVSGWRVYEPDAVCRLAQACGIVHGFAYHNAALDLHPINGNEEMDLIAKKNRFYSPVWLILPNHTREFYDADELRKRLNENKVEMVRLFPKFNSLSFSLSDWCIGEQLSMLEQRKTPVLLDQAETDWETVHSVCCAHPNLKIIITNLYYRHARYLLAIMRTHDNVYAETSGLKSFGLLQTFCETVGAKRLVFGSNLGTFSAGSAVCLVTYAQISAREKELIAHATLETLLERQVL